MNPFLYVEIQTEDLPKHPSYLDECSHHTKTSEPEILKGSGLAHSMEERIEKERNVSWREQTKTRK